MCLRYLQFLGLRQLLGAATRTRAGSKYRKSHGTLDSQTLGTGPVDQLTADFLEGLDLSTREGYSDAMVDLLWRAGQSHRSRSRGMRR